MVEEELGGMPAPLHHKTTKYAGSLDAFQQREAMPELGDQIEVSGIFEVASVTEKGEKDSALPHIVISLKLVEVLSEEAV